MSFVPLWEEIAGKGLDELVNDYGAEIVIQDDMRAERTIAVKIGGTEVHRQTLGDVSEPMGFQMCSEDGHEDFTEYDYH